MNKREYHYRSLPRKHNIKVFFPSIKCGLSAYRFKIGVHKFNNLNSTYKVQKYRKYIKTKIKIKQTEP